MPRPLLCTKRTGVRISRRGGGTSGSSSRAGPVAARNDPIERLPPTVGVAGALRARSGTFTLARMCCPRPHRVFSTSRKNRRPVACGRSSYELPCRFGACSSGHLDAHRLRVGVCLQFLAEQRLTTLALPRGENFSWILRKNPRSCCTY